MAFDYPRLLGRLVNRPLLVTPEKAQILLGVVAPRAKMHGVLVREDNEPVMLSDLSANALTGDRRERKIYRMVESVAVIPVEGSLVHKLGTLDPYSGMTGYDGIATKLNMAASDPDVRAILLDVDSPGGEVSGCFDLADQVHRVRASKPVWAVATESAYSAAFALASQAERVFVPRTGGLGSVGVVCMHADFSRALEEAGVTVTLIHAGAHKVDGNPYAPLPDEVRDRVKADCEAVRVLFADTVARGRGLDTKAVLSTEARCLNAGESVEAGFATDIGTYEQAMTALLDHLAGPGRTTGAAAAARKTAKGKKTTMAKRAKAANRAAEDQTEDKENAEVEEDEDPEAETDEQEEEAESEEDEKDAVAKAVAKDRKRTASIMGLAEAKGREALAGELAASGLSVDQARRALKAAPKGGGLAGAMAGLGNVELGHGGAEARGNGWGAAAQRVFGSKK
ncbi:S49 family peptidase [Telmatospirillum sp. J64-1]|uniref:S49 family peptidase n=1 Tax=Telmatospirillum sp. J64-1 TaxID=2502183 RepID=UPI001C8F4B48|nr:S49 family peptidase [Telmatospirillum sp. J64-1]